MTPLDILLRDSPNRLKSITLLKEVVDQRRAWVLIKARCLVMAAAALEGMEGGGGGGGGGGGKVQVIEGGGGMEASPSPSPSPSPTPSLIASSLRRGGKEEEEEEGKKKKKKAFPSIPFLQHTPMKARLEKNEPLPHVSMAPPLFSGVGEVGRQEALFRRGVAFLVGMETSAQAGLVLPGGVFVRVVEMLLPPPYQDEEASPPVVAAAVAVENE